MDEAPGGETVRVTPSLALPLAEIELRTSRSSGPGGQHAQKTSSRVEAVFDAAASPTLSEAQRERVVRRAGPVVHAVAQESRSQLRNRQLAVERLVEQLRAALHVAPRRRPTRPTRASKERRLDAKRRRTTTKQQRRRPDES